MGLGGLDVILKLPILDDLNDVSNLKQSTWVWWITQGFPGTVIWMWLQSYVMWLCRTFRPCCPGYECYIDRLENILQGAKSAHIYITASLNALYHFLIFYFLIKLLEGWLESHQSLLTIFFCTWCHIKDGLFFILLFGASVLVFRGGIWKITLIQSG